MKKSIFSLLILLSLSQFASAQTVDEAFKYARRIQGIERVTLSGWKMKMLRFVADKDDLPSSITALEVINCENSRPADLEKLSAKIQSIQDGNGYETYLKVQENGENVRIMVKNGKKEGIINEFVIMVTEPSEATLIRIEGEFTQEEMQKIMDKEMGKKGEK